MTDEELVSTTTSIPVEGGIFDILTTSLLGEGPPNWRKDGRDRLTLVFREGDASHRLVLLRREGDAGERVMALNPSTEETEAG